MSPVFGHGRLRLYLLKLLEESPKHGYEVIRLLQDRFLGVYAPSPGTIYPRLARLEEDGLVTHEEINGRKVYRLTDAGRAELERRLDELAELEEEITASVRDIAKEVREDVRETVRSLREELTYATTEARRAGRTGEDAGHTKDEPQRDQARRAGGEARGSAEDTWEEALHAEDEAGHDQDDARGHTSGRRPGAWWERDWQRWAEDMAEDVTEWGGAWSSPAGPRRDLERALRDFTREARQAVHEARDTSTHVLDGLRSLLDDTLHRLRTEVLTHPDDDHPRPDADDPPKRTGD